MLCLLCHTKAAAPTVAHYAYVLIHHPTYANTLLKVINQRHYSIALTNATRFLVSAS